MFISVLSANSMDWTDFMFLCLLMQAAVDTFDGIIDTVSALHPVMPLINLLKPDGKLVLLGSKTIESPVAIGGKHFIPFHYVIL